MSGQTCSRCGKAAPIAELSAYRGRCEECWSDWQRFTGRDGLSGDLRQITNQIRQDRVRRRQK